MDNIIVFIFPFYLPNNSMIRKAYKYRIYPNTEQKVFFAKCFGVGNGWKSGADYIISDDCKPNTGKALNGSNQRNPLLTKTIFATGSNQSKTNYNKCIELVKNSKWVKNDTFESFYNIAKKTYGGLVDFSLNGGSDNISFSSYMQKKLALAGGSSF